MSTPKRPRRRAGFTLLETVIAMGLMACVVINLPGLLLVLEQVEHDTTLRAEVLLCAQEKLEVLKFMARLGRLSPGKETEIMPPGPYERMQRVWEVRSFSGTPSLWSVKAACSCQRKQETIRKEIETLMFNDG